MTTVNIATLKNSLSHYLELVKAGEEVIVTSHRHPVAKLSGCQPLPQLPIVRPKLPTASLKKLKGVTPLRPCDPVAMLLADRAKR